MGAFSYGNPQAAVAFGILGDTISFIVYLAPIPTFWRIWRKRTTEEFQSVPYVVSLFSAMLWIYYVLIKGNHDLILLVINGFGVFIQTTYIVIFLTFAPRHAMVTTVKLLLLLNVGLFGLIIATTLFFFHGSRRFKVLGGICVAFSVSVFAAPLSVIRRVIRTRSVEFMPYSLSLSLTFSAVAWFLYGFFSKDMYIALPNVLGFTFGAIQMFLHCCYRNTTRAMEQVNDIESVAPASDTGEELAVLEAKHDSEGDTEPESHGHGRARRVGGRLDQVRVSPVHLGGGG